MLNPIGMHSSLWWGTKINNNIYKVIEYTAKTTADYMDINPYSFLNMSTEERKKLKRFANDCGVRLFVNGGVGPEYDIASADQEIRFNGISHIIKIIEAISDMDIPVWSGCMYAGYCTKPQGSGVINVDKANARKRSIESMQIILKRAKELGVILALEVLNRYEQYIINTVEEGVAYCYDTKYDNCKLLIDIFHMMIEENCIFDAICYAHQHDKIAYIHAGETNRRLPTGEASNVDWHRIADTLRKCNYTGAIVIEPFMLSTAHNAMRVCVWRDYMDPEDPESILAEAKKSIAFLRSL